MAFLPFLSSTCGLGVESSFSPSLLPFLESSILSWKAARSLFRYHLHINAARRLAGRHLMRRWQYLKIFVISYYYPLFDIFPFTLLQGLLQALLWVINKLTRYLGQKFRGDHRSWTRHNSSQACSTSPRRVILSLLLMAVLGYSFALRLDIGLGPFLRHLYVWG